MAKMASLHAEGVRDLDDYNTGYEIGKTDTLTRVINLIKVSLDSHDHSSTLIYCKFCDELTQLNNFIQKL